MMNAILFILPDLELNGAQTVFSELLNYYINRYEITIIAPSGGSYEAYYRDLGCEVVIRPVVAGNSEFRHKMQTNYKYVFMNTSSVAPYVYYFINTDVQVYWWLHETKEQLVSENHMLNPNLFSENIHLYAVTERVKNGIRELYQYEIDVLPMPIEEKPIETPRELDNKIRFFVPAAYTYIKGQDELLEAINLLPREMIDKSEFIFCGYDLPGQEEYTQKLTMIMGKMKNVKNIGAVSREEVYQWYEKCDCVVAPSRVDATPTSIVEALMFHRHVIVSKNAGVSDYLTDCVNGFVYEGVEELAKRLMLLIADYDSLQGIAEAGYSVYKNRFSKEAVWEKLDQIMGKVD